MLHSDRTKDEATRALLALVAVCAVALLGGAVAFAAWAGSDPPRNYRIGELPSACLRAPTGKRCVNAGVYYLDKARASLGLPAYKLPADFPSLTPAKQLFILTDLDRTRYGLPPMTGLTAALSRDAYRTGIKRAAEPHPSDTREISAWTANWAGGYANAPLAYEAWMYDDGPGSGNLDCTTANPSGCWEHRHGILWKFPARAVRAFGAAAGNGLHARSYAILLVGGRPGYRPKYAYTWRRAVADGAGSNAYNPGVPRR